MGSFARLQTRRALTTLQSLSDESAVRFARGSSRISTKRPSHFPDGIDTPSMYLSKDSVNVSSLNSIRFSGEKDEKVTNARDAPLTRATISINVCHPYP